MFRSADIRQLSSFVSPAFFDVIPARTLWTRGRELITTRASDLYTNAVRRRADALAATPLRIALGDHTASDDLLGRGKSARAERVVALYFEQLFSEVDTLIDLRPASFSERDGLLRWAPAPWVARWDPQFIRALRALYVAFYARDDARFRDSLHTLDLAFAEDLFREHFGVEQGDQTFVMRDFIDTFHRVFVRCRDRKTRLHADFLPLGVYLATLYEHLEALAVPVDVRAVFERITTPYEPRVQA